MTLFDAITARIIHPATLDGCSVWVCSTCQQYLCYAMGRYLFTCSCHNEALK